jgi:hypothetical protein
MKESGHWDEDPVLMTAAGYAKLVKIINRTATELEYNRDEQHKAIRDQQKISCRQSWMSTTDATLAHRVREGDGRS